MGHTVEGEYTAACDATTLAVYVETNRIAAQVVRLAETTATVADAARAVGVAPQQVVKTLLFLIDGAPILVIAGGLSPVDVRRLAVHFDVGKKRVKLARPDVVEKETGYPVGALPPFGHQKPIRTLVDRQVLPQPLVYAGGGAMDCLLAIAPDELLRVTKAQVVSITGEG